MRLAASAGAANVQRQHMGKLQHNKFIVVDGRAVKKVLCGSTNFSWRGLYAQANNASHDMPHPVGESATQPIAPPWLWP